jgi:glycosyltransferase involved in cell wall biosynthesis
MARRKIMHILHLIESSEPGGAETVLAHIADHLDPSHFMSTVGLLETGWLSKLLDHLGISYAVFHSDKALDMKLLFALVQHIRRNDVDLVHAHEFSMIVYGAVASRISRVPMIGTIHGKNNYPDRRRRRLGFKLAISLSEYTVTVSKELKGFLCNVLSTPSNKKIITIYNGIDVLKFHPMPKNKSLMKSLGLRDDQRVVGTVGSLFAVKGLQTLLQAAEKVVRIWPDVRFLVVGDGTEYANLLKLRNELGLDHAVIFTGFREDICEILNLMDIYVCSSTSEGLSLSILEAMACCKPVVATEVGGNPELVENNVSGFLVPVADPVALADRIQMILFDNELQASMGTNGRKIVEESFTLEKMVSRYQALYYELTDRARK